MKDNPNNDNAKPRDAVDADERSSSDEWVQVHQTHYDCGSDRELVTVLALTIAEAKGVHPLDNREMPPLFESIDAAALEDTFFGPLGEDAKHEDGGLVTFHYTEYKVALWADGWIFVYESR